MEEDHSVGEKASAIGSMQRGKSPGPDGYPTDFYKKFSRQLSSLLLSVFKESFFLRALPSTMPEAVISIHLKKGKGLLSQPKSSRLTLCFEWMASQVDGETLKWMPIRF